MGKKGSFLNFRIEADVLKALRKKARELEDYRPGCGATATSLAREAVCKFAVADPLEEPFKWPVGASDTDTVRVFNMLRRLLGDAKTPGEAALLDEIYRKFVLAMGLAKAAAK